MSREQLSQIIDCLQDEDTRLEGILSLKSLSYPEIGDDLVGLLDDSDWIVRWCVAEKLGDMLYKPAIPTLVRRLSDDDGHVRKNVIKSLYRIGLPIIPYLVKQFVNRNPQIRKYVSSLLLKFGKPALEPLSLVIADQNWVVSNRLIEMMWKIGGAESELFLIRQLGNTKVQKNVINLLGFIPSNRCVKALVKVYIHPSLKRMILHTLKRIGKEETYPVLIKLMFDSDPNLSKLARAMVIKIGEPSLPFVIEAMTQHTQYRSVFLKIVSRISKKMGDILAQASDDDTQLKFYVNQLRLRLDSDKKR